jgi:hypothetical protein
MYLMLRQGAQNMLCLQDYSWLKNVSGANMLFHKTVYHFDETFRHTIVSNATGVVAKKGTTWEPEDVERLRAFRSQNMMTYDKIGSLLNRTSDACRHKFHSLKNCW